MKSAERDVPDYVDVDQQQVDRQAHRACRHLSDVPYPVPMEPNLVVEFYSR